MIVTQNDRYAIMAVKEKRMVSCLSPLTRLVNGRES